MYLGSMLQDTAHVLLSKAQQLVKHHNFPWSACTNLMACHIELTRPKAQAHPILRLYSFHIEFLHCFLNQTRFRFVKSRLYEVEYNGCIMKPDDWAIVKPFTELFENFVLIQQGGQSRVSVVQKGESASFGFKSPQPNGTAFSRFHRSMSQQFPGICCIRRQQYHCLPFKTNTLFLWPNQQLCHRSRRLLSLVFTGLLKGLRLPIQQLEYELPEGEDCFEVATAYFMRRRRVSETYRRLLEQQKGIKRVDQLRGQTKFFGLPEMLTTDF